MHQVGISENVEPYVMEVQSRIISSFDIVKLESKEQDMNQVVANIVSNMDKLEAKAEQDKSLSEAEVVSLLIATTAAKSLTSAIVDVTTDFFTNLNVANGRNQAASRGFWSSLRAVFNVVTTVVIRSFTFVSVATYYLLTDVVGPFFGSCFSNGCNVDGLFNSIGNYIDDIVYELSHYECILPNDGWQCQ
jgi:hypothetical protein